MKSSSFGPCFLLKIKENTLCGITGLAMDDTLNTGNNTFQEDEAKATNHFITIVNKKLPLRFLGPLIAQEENLFTICQDLHISKLEEMPSATQY